VKFTSKDQTLILTLVLKAKLEFLGAIRSLQGFYQENMIS
jgi:hypothetical protein